MCLLAAAWAGTVLAAASQLEERPFSASPDHSAIEYASGPTRDAVASLNLELANAPGKLSHQTGSGYLQSVLRALQLPVDSQLMVFSKTGLQRAWTNPANPRALFFNDHVVLGYVRGAPVLELVAQDPRQGAIFYTLDQRQTERPTFVRKNECLTCHLSRNTLDVPGLLVRSQPTGPSGESLRQLGQHVIDHRSAFDQRWGGYFVTGSHGSMRHMGNAVVTNEGAPASTAATLNVSSLEGRFNTKDYPTPYSDVVALMVFDHQMRMMNLLTRVGWEARVSIRDHMGDLARGPLRDAVIELVDYLLFIDEAPLASRVQGVSGFAERFEAQRPRDKRNRSLYQLDLTRRLLRYPCSYMIYSDAFDALPSEATAMIYQRVWRILSGQEQEPRYAKVSSKDRRAVIEILRDTKKGLPAYFR